MSRDVKVRPVINEHQYYSAFEAAKVDCTMFSFSYALDVLIKIANSQDSDIKRTTPTHTTQSEIIDKLIEDKKETCPTWGNPMLSTQDCTSCIARDKCKKEKRR